MNRPRRRRGEDRRFTVEAVPRSQPDLHKLAQLFIGMAFARADAERANQQTPPSSPRHETGREVES